MRAARRERGDGAADGTDQVPDETPEERIEAAFSELNETLIADLLSQLGEG